jgi:hypothetical protein
MAYAMQRAHALGLKLSSLNTSALSSPSEPASPSSTQLLPPCIAEVFGDETMPCVVRWVRSIGESVVLLNSKFRTSFCDSPTKELPAQMKGTLETLGTLLAMVHPSDRASLTRFFPRTFRMPLTNTVGESTDPFVERCLEKPARFQRLWAGRKEWSAHRVRVRYVRITRPDSADRPSHHSSIIAVQLQTWAIHGDGRLFFDRPSSSRPFPPAVAAPDSDSAPMESLPAKRSDLHSNWAREKVARMGRGDLNEAIPGGTPTSTSSRSALGEGASASSAGQAEVDAKGSERTAHIGLFDELEPILADEAILAVDPDGALSI